MVVMVVVVISTPRTHIKPVVVMVPVAVMVMMVVVMIIELRDLNIRIGG